MSEHLAIVAVMASVLSTRCTDAADKTQFKITTKRDNDSVQVEVANSQGIFSVHNPFGISQVIIERTVENWPDSVLFSILIVRSPPVVSRNTWSRIDRCG